MSELNDIFIILINDLEILFDKSSVIEYLKKNVSGFDIE